MASITPDWQVLQLRGTVFSADVPHLDLSTIWRQVVGEDPEEEQNRPRQGLYMLTGPFGDWQLRVTGLPDRINWVITPGEEGYAEESRLGPSLTVELEAIHSLSEGWLSAIPDKRRLAFGAVVADPVENKREGYGKLSEILRASVAIDPDNSSDFLYQINRPRESIVFPHLMINRLSKWSVASRASYHMSLSPGGPPTRVNVTDEGTWLNLELDISTEADYSENLPNEKMESIFQELTELAVEIATKGDTA